MNKKFTLIFQLVAVAAQFGNQLSGLVPPKYQSYVLLGVGLAQTVQAWFAHNYNPDGTPAVTAYLPPK